DVNRHRIVDYVNLESADPPLDLAQVLMDGAHCGTSLRYQADGELGSMFCTNRLGVTNDVPSIPTYGILNQIMVGLRTNGLAPQWWTEYTDYQVNRFRRNLLNWGPLPNSPAYTNAPEPKFECPVNPTRIIYVYTSWKANDPLV